MERKYRVVGYSNFDDETVNEFFIQGPQMTKVDAEIVRDIFRRSMDEQDRYHYKVVEMPYTLYKFEP